MGKIKRIQFRGISRTPSDRLTADGGCAESLNAYVTDSEVAPVHEPVPCHGEFGLAEDIEVYEPIYVHKTNDYEHLITYSMQYGEIAYVVNGENVPILTLPGAQFLNRITHIGNTLIVSTDAQVIYLLYHKGEYKAINLNEEALPKLSFVNINQNAGSVEGTSYDIWQYDEFDSEYATYPNGDPEKDYLLEEDDNNKDAVELLQKMWASYRRMIDNNLAQGCFSQPIMLRYGIRLYDNSYIWASSPIMLGSCLPKENSSAIPFMNSADDTLPVHTFTASHSDSKTSKTFVQLATPFKIGVNFHRHANLTGLEDVISSIDVFLAPPIDFFPEGDRRVRSETITNATDAYYGSARRYIFDPVNSEDPKKVEEAVLSASTFFLIKRYTLDEIPQETDILSDNYMGEELFVKERLDDGNVMSLIANATNFGSYNSRLLAVGVDELISRGIGVLNGQHANAFESVAEDVLDNVTYAFAYHIPNKDLIIRDLDAKSGGNAYKMTPDIGKGSMEYNQIVDTLSTPYAWITHPYAECTKVSIRIYNEGSLVSGYELPMKPHPYLPCSYAFLGIGKRVYQANRDGEGDIDEFTDKPIVKNRNKVALSSSENPFAFGLAGKLTFGEEVIGYAIATEPMSVAQFGQFPIYFFLKDGVWTTTVSADGNFGSDPVLATRDVCSSPDTITPAKDMVFFMSRRGMLAISGRQTTCISEHMHGGAYNIPEDLIPLIEGAGYAGLVGEDDDSIESFMNYLNRIGTKVAYDYEGERLICFNNYYSYQYVYCLKTQTWHRTQYGKLNTKLNMYPRCVVTTKESVRQGSTYVAHHQLLDLSLTDDLTLTPKKILLVTRPFDLEEPDVLKTITDIRVRGQFAKGAFRIILQGSQDGINFYTISTLRGKSWKMFRIILMADLALHERISWVDVMFESRFTNRLR